MKFEDLRVGMKLRYPEDDEPIYEVMLIEGSEVCVKYLNGRGLGIFTDARTSELVEHPEYWWMNISGDSYWPAFWIKKPDDNPRLGRLRSEIIDGEHHNIVFIPVGEEGG